jgi:lysophospholipase L1-like esterase
MVLLLFVMSGLIYYMQQQIVWQGRGDGLVSQKQRPKQTIFQDDDIVNLANSRSSRIRGDYSTVQGIQDLNALAAKVPVQCSEGNIDCPCAAVHERDNDESTINTRLDPIPGMLLRWDETHERNIQLANLQQVVPPELLYEDLNHEPQGYTASSQNNNTRTLSTAIAPNVVFLGDSITERWQGTKLGKVDSADMQDAHKVFMELFQSDNMDAHPLLSNATAPPIHGLPLGIAGDQTPNLLWRLQNGELPSTLHPNIFVVLIGTNDLSKDGCSAENVVVGVVRIVEWLLQEREDATILLHGLLPRTFEEDGTLNPGNGHNWGNFLHHRNDDDDGVEDEASQHHFWPDIHVINDELQGYALFRDRVEYMDTNAFYSDTNGNHLSSGKLKLNMNLMPDGLHPSSEGCRIWGREIKTKLQEMLSTVGRG